MKNTSSPAPDLSSTPRVQVNLRMDATEREQLQAKAASVGLSLSEFLRSAADLADVDAVEVHALRKRASEADALELERTNRRNTGKRERRRALREAAGRHQ